MPLTQHRVRIVPVPVDAIDRRLRESRQPGTPSPPPDVRADVETSLALSRDLCRDDPERWQWHTPWDIVRKADGARLGALGFAGPPDLHGEVVLAYWMDIQYQNRGYMTEAVHLACVWAFKDPATRRVIASAAATHRASQRVLEKNRFVQRGQWRGHPRWELARAFSPT